MRAMLTVCKFQAVGTLAGRCKRDDSTTIINDNHRACHSPLQRQMKVRADSEPI
ncbi:hypothetical protein TcasGA2_TC000692 [Tribolium castaneum]|uniref:Uncharacterized protein n=1 Tax=Tribolium castaneum TaxID=7070 RepID=D6W8V4_TRICA|nr:hypothetical protein TcasGA2_TC000692 [Tribolium castaneum]